jgi:DNA-binding NtrC family response regulator
LVPVLQHDAPHPLEGGAADLPARWCVLIVGDDRAMTLPLPATGPVTIGRGDADIALDGAGVARRHARLHLGDAVELEDLGTAAGTRVDGRPLASGSTVALEVGATIEIGRVMMVLQDRRPTEGRRRIWGHGQFEARIEEACARADATHRPFAVLRLRAGRGPTSERVVHEVLASLRPVDVVARYGPADYEVLVTDIAAAAARALVGRLRAALDARAPDVAIAMVSYPQDGRGADAGMARVGAALDGAAAGADAIVETGGLRRLGPLLARIAASDRNLLLVGEPGVGKAVVAACVHARAPRGPMWCVDCAAQAPGLVERALFEPGRGALGGGAGTLFLAAIDALPSPLQERVARALAARPATATGLRVIAASHRDLEAEVWLGRFDPGLLAHVGDLTVVVPPLRERLDELEPLARAFVTAACRRQGKVGMALAPGALRAMRGYAWPGNVRELRNIVERAVRLCPTRQITLAQLPADKMASAFAPGRPSLPRAAGPAAEAPRRRARDTAGAPTLALRAGIKTRERALIADALARCGDNQTRAAQALGISRRTLIARIEAHGLPRPRKAAAGVGEP